MAKKTPISKLARRMTKQVRGALKEASTIVVAKVRENASLTDHSLDELEALGHPYAVRAPRNIHRPGFKVHEQSGRLVSNVEVKQKGDLNFAIGVDEAKVPYVPFVIFGTRTLVARDFITGSLNQVKTEITKIVNTAVKKAIKETGGK